MNGVQATWDDAKSVAVIPVHPALTINRLTHMLFQGMFFVITPALICGAFAERMKFSTMVVFMILWGTLVYCPLCHAVWGGGVLQYLPGGNPIAFAGGALDFAGGTVVHISSGVSALVCALVLGQAVGLRQRTDAAAQSDLHCDWRRDALGWLVRFQRRQRVECRRFGGQRVLRDTFRRGGRRA